MTEEDFFQTLREFFDQTMIDTKNLNQDKLQEAADLSEEIQKQQEEIDQASSLFDNYAKNLRKIYKMALNKNDPIAAYALLREAQKYGIEL